MIDGGYDVGYKQCPCFWGLEPGSLVKELMTICDTVQGQHVLDAGCGEGKNSLFLASKGAMVRAIDISEYAIANARQHNQQGVDIIWEVADIKKVVLPVSSYDIVLAYGLMHCMENEEEIKDLVLKLKQSTKTLGYNVICAFNSRFQDLSAHPGFKPCLLTHKIYEDLYADWNIITSTDKDLKEIHPHNNILHTHSMTRIIAQKRENNDRR